ncbi:13178_t:CDS:2, partial [Gigaspora margarita]
KTAEIAGILKLLIELGLELIEVTKSNMKALLITHLVIYFMLEWIEQMEQIERMKRTESQKRVEQLEPIEL